MEYWTGRQHHPDLPDFFVLFAISICQFRGSTAQPLRYRPYNCRLRSASSCLDFLEQYFDCRQNPPRFCSLRDHLACAPSMNDRSSRRLATMHSASAVRHGWVSTWPTGRSAVGAAFRMSCKGRQGFVHGVSHFFRLTPIP